MSHKMFTIYCLRVRIRLISPQSDYNLLNLNFPYFLQNYPKQIIITVIIYKF